MDKSRLVAVALMAVLNAPLMRAQFSRPAVTKGVSIEQKLNAPVPLDLVFRDENNRVVPLRTYFGERPVVLALVYFHCPSLCDMTLNELTGSLSRVPFTPGKDYETVVVSFDPADTPQVAAEKKLNYSKLFTHAGFNQGFHFLTGTQDSISKLAAAVGFHYKWDETSRQFIHAGGIEVATPDGKLSRYFYGIRYAAGDLRMALVEASQEKIGTPVDDALLFCFHYDVSQGKYTLAIVNILKLGAAITLLCLVGLLYALMKFDKNKHRHDNAWKEAHRVS